MTLKLYVDRVSQPARAVILFCKVNGIDFKEIPIDLSKGQHLSPQYAEINPLQKLPTIVDGRFVLSESHAILIYLACSYPGVADHWYPADVCKRAKIHSVLNWYHSNLRRGSMRYFLNSEHGARLGRRINPQAAATGEILFDSSLSKIETIWLKGTGKFLMGSNQPSIADISLVCEIVQLEALDEKDHARILGPYKKVQRWIEATKDATKPHFDEVHSILFKVEANIQNQKIDKDQAGSKTALHSKI